METLARNFRDEVSLAINYDRYRLLQYYSCLHSRSWRGLITILKYARADEIARYGAIAVCYAAAYVLPPSLRRRVQGSIRASLSAFPSFNLRRKEVPQRDLLEAICQYKAE
jgi:hypothetical protein